jgi:hypothetical protein
MDSDILQRLRKLKEAASAFGDGFFNSVSGGC